MALPQELLKTSPDRPAIARTIDKTYLATARHAVELMTWIRLPLGPLTPKFMLFYQAFGALWTLTSNDHETRNTELHTGIRNWLNSPAPITTDHARCGLMLFERYREHLTQKRMIAYK